jgi:hypothetical protein
VPLTVTTDLTVLSTAEVLTNWVSIGAGGAGAMALEPDYYVQGSNSISRGVSGAATEKGMWFNNGTGINFTTGTHQDKLVYIWMYVTTPGLTDTLANGGVKVWLGTNTTNYRTWIVGGNDTVVATDGWVCYVIDPQSAGTADTGTYNAASVQYFGGTIKTTANAKGQNFGIDQISYGRGEIYVSGTNTATGEGFKEIAAVAYDSARTNRWGIITVRAGVYYVKGKIILGHATSNTAFSSRGETVVWETPFYRNAAASKVKAIPDASVGATAGADGLTTYNGVAVQGGTGTTAIDFGVLAGSNSGRSGSLFICASNPDLTTPGRSLAGVAASDATMALSLYASSFVGFEGGVDLYGTGIDDDDLFACTFDGCGRLRSNMEMRTCNILNSVAAVDDGAYLWESTTNLQECLFVNNSRAIVFESATGSPFAFTSLTFGSNTFDVRNESGGAITINVVDSTTPTYEDIGGGSSTTLVIDPVTTAITVRDIVNSEPIENARVLLYASDNTGPLPSNESVTITRASSVATVSHTAHGIPDGTKVMIKGANQPEYNGVFTTTYINANSYSYIVTGAPATPATGTILATGVVLQGLTSAAGLLDETRSWASAQPVVGRVRRASAPPPPSPIETTALGDFDTNTDKLTQQTDVPTNLKTAYTICGWFKRSSNAAQSLLLTPTTAANAYNTIFVNTSGEVRVGSNLGSSSSIATVSLDTWYFFAMTQSGATRQLTGYVGGAQAGTITSQVATSVDDTDAITNIFIGGGNVFGDQHLGSLTEVRIWNTELNSTQIEAERDGWRTPANTVNLTGRYPLVDDTTKLTAATGTNLNTTGAGSWSTDTDGPFDEDNPYAPTGVLYKTAPVAGTISSTAGLSLTVQLIRDE